LGAVRTGAIGGVAIKYMSRPDSMRLGILGSGIQARTQLEAATSVRRFELVKVYSPNAQHRQKFVDEMKAKLRLNIEAVASAEEAVRDADVLVSATPATSPIYQAAWLKPGVHINALGVKFKQAHEIDLDVADRSQVVATDSLAQVEAYGDQFLLSGTPHQKRLIELCDVVAGKKAGRSAPEDITLFCSMGLAGTEVVLADRVFAAAGRK
ncbi:MAG: ornithine cyclodeaminase family protein, partial [Dehalococcoidia bacterium]|nr:ornithine cyclodeaminase family protein [Dehalococcoidia bacterium]